MRTKYQLCECPTGSFAPRSHSRNAVGPPHRCSARRNFGGASETHTTDRGASHRAALRSARHCCADDQLQCCFSRVDCRLASRFEPYALGEVRHRGFASSEPVQQLLASLAAGRTSLLGVCRVGSCADGVVTRKPHVMTRGRQTDPWFGCSYRRRANARRPNFALMAPRPANSSTAI
jgi:hypothetical protein